MEPPSYTSLGIKLPAVEAPQCTPINEIKKQTEMPETILMFFALAALAIIAFWVFNS